MMTQIKISYNDRTLFHMLRHFKSINDEARACLLVRGYKNSLIDQQFAMLGSKFHLHFADDLKSLELRLQAGMIKDSYFQNGYLHQSIEFDSSLLKSSFSLLSF